MKLLNKFLFFGLIALVYNLILELQHSQEVLVPTGWAVAIDIGRQYILWTGHSIDELSCRYITWQSGLSQYGGQDVFSKIFFAEVNLFTGYTEFPSSIGIISHVPIATLLLVICVLAAYRILTKHSKRNWLRVGDGLNSRDLNNTEDVENGSFIDYIILLSICVFPLHSAIMPGSINGTYIARALFILLILCLFSSLSFPGQNRYILVTFTFLLFPYYFWYHTWAYYGLSCFIVIFLVSLIFIRKELIKASFIGILSYFIIGTYLNYYQMIEQPTLSGKVGLDFLMMDIFGKTEVATGFTIHQPLQTLHSTLQLVSVIIILTILIIITIECLIKIKYNRRSEVYFLIICIIFSIPLVGMFLFVQGGMGTLAGRLFEYVLYVYLIGSACLLSPMGQRKFPKWIVQALLIISVFICIISIPLSESRTSGLDYQEYIGISFFGENTDTKSPVFSDFRLGTPFLYYSKEAIYTIDSPKQSQTGDFMDIMGVYYNESIPHIVLDKVIPNERYYVFTSKRQSIVSLKDTSFTENLKPARQGFQNNFERDSCYEKLYSSGEVILYQR